VQVSGPYFFGSSGIFVARRRIAAASDSFQGRPSMGRSERDGLPQIDFGTGESQHKPQRFTARTTGFTIDAASFGRKNAPLNGASAHSFRATEFPEEPFFAAAIPMTDH
jgi:hypothetical protein